MNSHSDPSPKDIVEHMLKNDPFSQWLDLRVLEIKEGSCLLECIVTEKMLNGYQIAHGGVLFSLADSAIAFTSASYGRVAVAIDYSISFIKKVLTNDLLTIKAEAISMGNKTGVIKVEITNDDEKLVAVVKGTVYRTSETFNL